ncbi:hypothetical protein H8D30_05780, partial [bacterium]|nr:hypothetical protein [bacterium]
MQRKKTISRNRRSPWGVLGILLFIILSAGPFPVLLTTLDPIGALKWRGAEGCLPDTPCGIARPLLLRGGADGGGLYWHQESLERGTRVLALSESGQAVGVGTGWGGHLAHLEGMGSQKVKLAVESPTGYSAVWAG